MKERLQELEEILTPECTMLDGDCSKCSKKDECDEYSRLNQKCGKG